MVKWGIVGSGQIANKFAADFSFVKNAKLGGVASRNFDSAQKLASKFHIDAFPTIDDLLTADLDVVYVATPHPLHKSHALLALKSGKAVLSEKPFTMNSLEAEEVILTAKERHLFLMEGMWTRFIPTIREIVEIVRSGQLGQIRRVEANFGYHFPFSPSSRVFNLDMGGGSLLDVGIYCISFFQMILQDQPIEIETQAQIGISGVDESAQWKLKYPNGIVAEGYSSIVKDTSHEAIIEGTNSAIRIPKFWCPREYSFGGIAQRTDFKGNGFQFEAQEVTNCILQKKVESEIMPLGDTSHVMTTLDLIRQQWGLRYPNESWREQSGVAPPSGGPR
jgi:predicted dehydrogenase